MPVSLPVSMLLPVPVSLPVSMPALVPVLVPVSVLVPVPVWMLGVRPLQVRDQKPPSQAMQAIFQSASARGELMLQGGRPFGHGRLQRRPEGGLRMSCWPRRMSPLPAAAAPAAAVAAVGPAP
jgi:hypothetical protein